MHPLKSRRALRKLSAAVATSSVHSALCCVAVKTYHGFLYIKGGNNKSRLLFDLNDNLAGIQTAVSI